MVSKHGYFRNKLEKAILLTKSSTIIKHENFNFFRDIQIDIPEDSGRSI
jgi:hypothetical protein